MTNEEKAKELVEEYTRNNKDSRYNYTYYAILCACKDMAEFKDKQIIELLPEIIICVKQGFTQCATDNAIIKELTNLIKKTENYEK